jgi:curved DNA-binding protein CbpA
MVVTGRFREINEAHSVLSNTQARAEYDRSLAAQRGAAALFGFVLWPAVLLSFFAGSVSFVVGQDRETKVS